MEANPMRIQRLFVILPELILTASLFGQASITPEAGKDSPPQAVEVKRLPPPSSIKSLPKEAVPGIGQYPFGNLISALEETAPAVKVPSAPQPHVHGVQSEIPDEWRMSKDVPLSQTARDALNVSQAWMTEKHVPAPGKDGRVLYTFGAGLPTVVCAPLRICVLELEPGEKVAGEPQIGDAVRWIIAPATSGPPDLLTSMIVIKPKQSGLDTNLLITTDRRAYYVRLISKSEDYLARIAFSYPEGEVSKWRVHMAELEQRRRNEANSARIDEVETMENLYFDYRISNTDEYLRPVRVVDDGKKTFIQMPPGMAVREVPVLVVLGTDAKPEIVNYRVKGNFYIVDRLFERGALLLGAGKKQQRAEIIRGTYRGKSKIRSEELYRDFEGSEKSKND